MEKKPYKKPNAADSLDLFSIVTMIIISLAGSLVYKAHTIDLR